MLRWSLLIVAVLAGVAFACDLVVFLLRPDADTERAWTAAWLVWLVSATLSFAVIEGLALFNDESNDTLTEQIGHVAGQSPIWAVVISGGIGSFFLWFLSHLFGRDSQIWDRLRARQTKGDA